MSKQVVKTNICEFVSFSHIEIKKEVNNHLMASIKGYIDAENYALASSFNPKSIVDIKDEQGENLLAGNITQLLFTKENELWFMEIRIISLTQKLDNKEQIRTFQDGALSYSDVAAMIDEEAGGDYNIIIPQRGTDSIGKMFVQYKETDWEFFKRMASRLNTYLVADHQLHSPSISLGIPRRANTHTISPKKYTMVLDADEMRRNSQKSQSDCTYFCFDNLEHFNLATRLIITGEEWLVWSVESRLVKSELIHSYVLKTQGAFTQKEYFNEKIIGAELTGAITNVDKKLVQLKISGDIKQKEYKWFDYATVYSSQGNIGWYFMPEVGSRSRITFPTEKEYDAFVSSAVHEGSRDNEEIKSIRTPYAQEIVFAPEYIRIADSVSEVLFSEENGLRFQSQKDISIDAKDNITMESTGKIDMRAKKNIKLTQAGSTIYIEDNIDIISDHVRIK